MIDTHYDLLTIAYVAYLNNDYSYLEKISHYFNKDNVTGVIANLYFMSLEEMKNELHPEYYNKKVSVLDMFVKAKEILDFYLPNTDKLYSIEGADYISGEDELEKLHKAGLNSLIIAWNTKSKYASGNRSIQGLTEKGKSLLSKAIDLGIFIDFSHANENTFIDMFNLIKEKQDNGISVVCFASHSNSRKICNVQRNLTDEQLFMLKEINALVGVFSNRNFIVTPEDRDNASFKLKNEMYIKHLDYIKGIIGEDNVMLATDNMDFCKGADKEYGELAIYNYCLLKNEITESLSSYFNENTIKKFMYLNAKKRIFEVTKTKLNIKHEKR